MYCILHIVLFRGFFSFLIFFHKRAHMRRNNQLLLFHLYCVKWLNPLGHFNMLYEADYIYHTTDLPVEKYASMNDFIK